MRRPAQPTWRISTLSLHAELAMDYFELRGLDSDARLLERTVADYQHQLDLNQQLVRVDLGTEVVVAQALTQLETTRAQLVDVNQARSQYRTCDRHAD